MNLKELLIDSKSAWVDFPGLPGFEVEVVNLSRKELNKLRKRATTQKFDRNTHKAIETLNEELFVSEFTKATVKDWKGLKLKYLEELILVDLEGKDVESELEFSLDNAESLVTNSNSFDSWLNEVVFDICNFSGRPDREHVEET